MRDLQEIRNQPCRMKLKDINVAPAAPAPAPTDPPKMIKVKKTVQKMDESGNPIYKTITVEKNKGCGCKGKAQETVVEEQKVPETIEVWVEVPADQASQTTSLSDAGAKTGPIVFCKLYGMVPENFCLRCNSYKK